MIYVICLCLFPETIIYDDEKVDVGINNVKVWQGAKEMKARRRVGEKGDRVSKGIRRMKKKMGEE